jgi:hypothetical protein
VLLTYDDENLYVGAKCYLPKKTEVKNNKNFSWKKDLIQIFIEPERDGKYYDIAVNIDGNIYMDYHGKKFGTKDKIKYKITVKEKYWIVEMAIPFKKVNLKPEINKVLGFNVVTYQPNSGEAWGSWSPLFGSPAQNSEKFGNMRLGKEYFRTNGMPRTPEEDDF